MAKIQARNVDDALFVRIEQSAMKNEHSLEGEIRLALARQYPDMEQAQDVSSSSMRQRWQQETGQRQLWLLQRLNEDGVGTRPHAGSAGIADLVCLGVQLGICPGLLMDIAEGDTGITPGLADALEKYCGVRTEWLMTGEGDVFPVQNIATCYEDFFLPEDGGVGCMFEVIRISRGFHEGTALCLRRSAVTGHTVVAVLTGTFHLSPRNGSGGRRSLLQFLTFLKEKGHRMSVNTFDWAPEDEETELSHVAGTHHPLYFQHAIPRTSAGWLQPLLGGMDPGEWFTGHTGELEALAAVSYDRAVLRNNEQ